ncbi:hypothetical protein LCGC14_2646360 [marine sediment metagenome]|uniref:Uncharacterized protein n=1 Tax=marine sediment metagenome TaxID=412755 RepID=A0A0F8ZW42_9ZZZZ
MTEPLRFCIASIGDGHEATETINELPYCSEHADRLRRIVTAPPNLKRHLRKLRRMTGPGRTRRRVRYMEGLSERERIWVSKSLAGGD